MSERAWQVLHHVDAVWADPDYYLALEIDWQASTTRAAIELERQRHENSFKLWTELLHATRYTTDRQGPGMRFLERTTIIMGVSAVLVLIVVIELVTLRK